jgi:hypothetical protein
MPESVFALPVTVEQIASACERKHYPVPPFTLHTEPVV